MRAFFKKRKRKTISFLVSFSSKLQEQWKRQPEPWDKEKWIIPRSMSTLLITLDQRDRGITDLEGCGNSPCCRTQGTTTVAPWMTRKREGENSHLIPTHSSSIRQCSLLQAREADTNGWRPFERISNWVGKVTCIRIHDRLHYMRTKVTLGVKAGAMQLVSYARKTGCLALLADCRTA